MYSKTLLIRIFSKIDKYGSTSRVHKNFFHKRTGSVKTTSDLCADEDATIKSTTSTVEGQQKPCAHVLITSADEIGEVLFSVAFACLSVCLFVCLSVRTISQER